MDQPTIGLALGGGGARGFAHIGALQVLHEENIPISFVAGTSMGAIVGAMYAESLDPFTVERKFREFVQTDTYREMNLEQVISKIDKDANFWDYITSEIRGHLVLQMARNRISLLKSDPLVHLLEALLTIETFEQCKIPFVAVATDLITGQDVVLRSGKLLLAVQASASIPGYLPPITIDEQMLCDGGITCPVPVKYAKESSVDLVIGIAVPPQIDAPRPLGHAVDLLSRAEQITSYYYSNTLMAEADIEIFPKTGAVQWNEFNQMTEMIQAGREATKSVIPAIREIIRQQIPWWQLLLQRIT